MMYDDSEDQTGAPPEQGRNADYVDIPFVGRVPAKKPPAEGQPSSSASRPPPGLKLGNSGFELVNSFAKGGMMRDLVTNPEAAAAVVSTLLTGGATSIPLAGSTAARLGGPPIAAALMSILNDVRGGNDAYSTTGDALGHAALNVVPGVGGMLAKEAKTSVLAGKYGVPIKSMKERLAEALTEGGKSSNMLGTLSATAGRYLSEPAVTLPKRFVKGGIFPSGVANQYGNNVMQALRAILAGASLTKSDQQP